MIRAKMQGDLYRPRNRSSRVLSVYVPTGKAGEKGMNP
jgi:hypothetical protein